MDLFESRVEQVILGGLRRVLDSGRELYLQQINKNWDFYNGDQLKYLKQYPGEDFDEFITKAKGIFNYTAAVVNAYISGVYQLPVVRTFGSDENNEIVNRITSYCNLNKLFKKIQKVAELSSLCGVVIRYSEREKRIFFDVIPGEYVKIYSSNDYADKIDQIIIAYEYDNEDDRGVVLRVEGWSRDRIVILESYAAGKKRITDKVFDEKNVLVDEYGYKVIPVTLFSPDEDPYSPYGYSNINTSVNLNEIYNQMWMDVMRTVQMQQFSILFMKRPKDVVDRKEPDPLRIAPTRFLEETHKDADAKYITPSPKISEALSALSKLRDEILDLSGVPAEVFGGESKTGVESAHAIKLRRAPLERIWKQRKTSYGASEVELWKKVICVARAVWHKGNVTDMKVNIDFSEAETPETVQEFNDRAAFELTTGLTNPYQLFLDKNKDVGGIDKAKSIVDSNITINRKILTGLSDTDNAGSFEEKIARFKELAKQAHVELSKDSNGS